MNIKDNKKKIIVNMLIDNSNPIKIKELSSHLDVSEKTVRNYLDEIEEFFLNNGAKLIRKPSVGIYLEIDEKNKAILKRKIYMDVKRVYSSEYREEYILKTLFRNRYTYTVQLLADDLYCSKSTIFGDLINVEKWLENNQLSLKRKQNQGLWIEGSESYFRDAMMGLFFEIKEEDSSEGIDNDEINKLDYRINLINYKKIKQLFPNLNIYKIQTIIQQSEMKLGYFFTDQAFINLIAHIAITIQRVKFNKKIEIKTNCFDGLKINKEYNIAKWVVEELSKEFKLKIQEEEISYITLHMLGSKIQEDVSIKNFNSILNSYKKSEVDFAKEIIYFVGHILDIDLSRDELLLVSLAIHLRPTIIRLKNGLQLRNPLLQKIKTEYVSIFGATWACGSLFEKKFGVWINEDEVAFVALHIAVAIERLKKKITAIVVCSSGIGTSQMVAERLKKQFQDIEIVGVIPMNSLTDKIMEGIDLIVTTVSLRESKAKTVYVSTFMDEKDRLEIKSIIDIIKLSKNEELVKYNNENNKSENNHSFKDIISADYCFIDRSKKTYLEIVEKYATIMEKNGIGKKGFCENVIDREKKSSTILGYGIVIPHSKEEFVQVPKVCVVKLENPVEWNKENIDLIIILSLKFNNLDATKQFFKDFYSMLDDNEFMKRIKNTKNEEDIVSLFSERININ